MASDYSLVGFGIAGFKSFSLDHPARLGPFGKIHVLAGQNNAGKSSLADCALRLFNAISLNGTLPENNYPFIREDVPNSFQGLSPTIKLTLGFALNKILENEKIQKLRPDNKRIEFESFLQRDFFSRGCPGVIWVDFQIPAFRNGNGAVRLQVDSNPYKNVDTGLSVRNYIESFSNTIGGDSADQTAHILDALIPWDSIPRVVKIDAIRKVVAGDPEQQSGQASGFALPRRLLRLSNPGPAEQRVAGEQWERFRSFVRDVLNDQSAEVRIDADASMIQVSTQGEDFLPLSSLGTGIEELVIIAAAISVESNKLIFIEEPEIHLHPEMQLRLLRYLESDDRGNRFLVTTHSPTIINCGVASITQITKDGEGSRTRELNDLASARNALDDIGAHPSDLLQSNYVIWVEGPSDRIYVNYWLSVVAPELREGQHYSVMFYGGKLLNACSAGTEEEVGDLISLFRINTHFCVLMDSDRDKKGARINTTKKRIVEECKQSGNQSWITDGRTIENYVPADCLKEALVSLYPGRTYRGKLNDQYALPLGVNIDGLQTKPDKIRVAKWVSSHGHPLSRSLERQAKQLATSIRLANGLESSAENRRKVRE